MQPSNISHYDGDVHAIVINRYDVRSTAIDNRNMRYTAMNEPAIRPTGTANTAMAETTRFSRSNNNECM